MEFRDLINSATSKPVNGADEARFSFFRGGYVEDFQPQGVLSSVNDPLQVVLIS